MAAEKADRRNNKIISMGVVWGPWASHGESGDKKVQKYPALSSHEA